MMGAASQAREADFSRAPCLTSGFQRFMDVHLGTLLFVSQLQYISSFVFYYSPSMQVYSDSLLSKFGCSFSPAIHVSDLIGLNTL